MILIADSGSTKTEWRVAENGNTVRQILTAGTNPYFQTPEEIKEELDQVLFPAISHHQIDAIYFYGAGCAFAEKKEIIRQVISTRYNVPIEIYSDLMGAARSMCKRFPGIACILGTGSNSCLYDGVEIIAHTPSLGFILGDEGSGSSLGKRLVGDCLKGQFPSDLAHKFLKQYDLTTEDVLERVYKQPFPNRYLAFLSQFLIENITEPYIRDLVHNEFKTFLERNVRQYKGSDKYPIHFTGSIAHFYQGILREATIAAGMHPGMIVQSPMPGLINFHTEKEE